MNKLPQLRDAVITEAMSWINTPAHDQQGVKGVGVDCAYLVGKIAESVGLIEKFQVKPYNVQQFWHSSEEMMCDIMEGFGCIQKEGPPIPGDIICFAYVGTACNHLGIMINETQFVHLHFRQKKVLINTLSGEYCEKLRRIYNFPGIKD